MFLEKVQENNKPLVEYAFELQQKGLILPDTYVLDYDAIMENGKYMKDAAAPLGIKLYFMLKQIGRNPEIAKGLMEVGFDGVVAVDFKETLVMMKNGVKLGNIGHLVQVPKAALKEVVSDDKQEK
jgi:predicted amino acid racemase